MEQVTPVVSQLLTQPPLADATVAPVQVKTISEHIWFSLSFPSYLVSSTSFYFFFLIQASKLFQMLCHIFSHLLSSNFPLCM